ncbi:hypothetical protein F5Y16DRAFT_367347, partial [Xylariaceae sp. FL0255]
MAASDSGAWMHTDHCIEAVRLALMCHGDTTPAITILESGCAVWGNVRVQHGKEVSQIRATANMVGRQCAQFSSKMGLESSERPRENG